MPASNIITNVQKNFVKTITFTATGNGALGTVTIGTVTGRILLTHLQAYCSTGLTSGGAPTLELGVAGNTAGLIAQIADATDLIATEYWNDATPTDVLASDAIINKLVASDVILTVGTATITAGVIEFAAMWSPLSVDGNLA